MNDNEEKTFSEEGGHALLYEAVALARIIEGKVINAPREPMQEAFRSRGAECFDCDDMVSLCTVLRKKIEEAEKIAGRTA